MVLRNRALILTLGLSLLFGSGQKIDLNEATSAQLATLPLSAEQILAIEQYLSANRYFKTIYGLAELPGFSIDDVHKLKFHVEVRIPELSDFLENSTVAAYKVDQWLAAEGNTEGLSEIWLDRSFDPADINTMNYDDLIALPNLSPIDVVAVLKQQQRGEIKGSFELRNAPGISYYGYRNLIDFIRFETDTTARLRPHARITQLFRTVPVTTNPDDEGLFLAFADASRPENYLKASIVYGNHLKAGYGFRKNMGDPEDIFSEKKYFSIEKINWGPIQLDRLVLGNYSTSFGQGVVMETGDFFSPRRTGYGFTKRAEGIYPDATRSIEYVLNGAALQFSSPWFRGAFFGSKAPRDAIINADSSFSTLIVMQPRLPWGAYEDTTKIYNKLTSSVTEVTWGGNLRISPMIGLNIGFTFYESLYDRELSPQVVNTITGGVDDDSPEFDSATDYDAYSGDAFYLQYMTNSADPEIAAMYRSSGKSDIWDRAQSFRRVSGLDFTWVIGNIAFQGEYGELSLDNKVLKLGNDPHAYVLNAYIQFDNLNILALHRNYDLEFDNPYQRSFSNYQRFKTTILEDSYWLEDPVYSYLYSGNPQPQAEVGTFLSGRYQFHRSFVGTLNWDTWTRQADKAKYYRTVATIDWRPVFNYRINIRQKWQERGALDVAHPSPFESRETRIRITLRMSRFNQFVLLYARGHTTFSPRPRLTGNALAGADMVVGDVGTPDETLGFAIDHHFDPHFSIRGGSSFIKGFLWFFEDTDFRILNSESGAIHNWIAFNFAPNPHLSLRFKVSHTINYPSTRITAGQTSMDNWVRNPLVNNQNTDFRIQLDYAI